VAHHHRRRPNALPAHALNTRSNAIAPVTKTPPRAQQHGGAANDDRQGKPRRQVPRRTRQGIPHRHAGPGPPAHAAARTRPPRRAAHRRLCLGLPRLAAGRARLRPAQRRPLPQAARHHVSARPQRGHRRHRGVGHAAVAPVSAAQVRRHFFDVVRQGAGRRSQRRRVPPRQPCRHLEARRRAADRRRRPLGALLRRGAPERAHLLGLRHPGAGALQPAGIPRLRPARLGHVALLGLLGGAEADLGHRRKLGRGQRRSRPLRVPHPDRFPVATRRRAPALARSATGAGTPPAAVQGVCGDRLRPRQRPQPHDLRQPAPAAGHHRLRQGLHGRAPGARRHVHRRKVRRRDRPAPVQGRHALAAGSRVGTPLRRRPGRNPGGRGKAPDHRVPAQGNALQLA
jgi:hypothetical protein